MLPQVKPNKSARDATKPQKTEPVQSNRHAADGNRSTQIQQTPFPKSPSSLANGESVSSTPNFDLAKFPKNALSRSPNAGLSTNRQSAQDPLETVDRIGDEDAGAENDAGDDPGSDDGEDQDEDEGDSPTAKRLVAGLKERREIEIQGWIGQGYTANPSRPASRSNGTLGMNDLANQYQFSQLGMSVDRPWSTENGNRRLGFRMDLMFGRDARFVQSIGFDDTWNLGGDYPLAMPQLYLDWHFPELNRFGPGVTLRLGKFWSPIGYEGVPSMDRYFFSATNAFMFAQPSTHTGGMLQVPLGTNWTLQLGLVNGWDVWRDNNDSLAGLGTLGWINDDESASVTHVLYFGNQDDILRDRQVTYELIVTRQLTERWNYAGWFDFNFADEIGTDRFGNPSSAQWYSINHTLIYSVNDRWSIGTRLEWFHDHDGVRLFDPITGNSLGAGDLFAWTLGANYTPTANWIVRPELRWDWANRIVPFDDLTSRAQLTAAIDLILLF